MYIIKRKYMIKIISFLSAFAVVIATNLMLISSDINTERKHFDNTSFSAVANMCAAVNSIKSSMEKGQNGGDISAERINIHSQCNTVKLAVNLSGYPMTNTSLWFDNLADYATTEMTDKTKNEEYYKKITEADSLLIKICGNFRKQHSIKQIDDLFAKKENSRLLQRTTEPQETTYHLLNNQPKAERKKINAFAEELFDTSFVPDTFKGNYALPDSVTFISQNSYASICRYGGYLYYMATSGNITHNSRRFSSADDAAEKYLKELAPYAVNMKCINKEQRNGIIYYTFCPDTTNNITNTDEKIRLALSSSGYRLMAFDSAPYLKHHIP